jgi:hypothetical protein
MNLFREVDKKMKNKLLSILVILIIVLVAIPSISKNSLVKNQVTNMNNSIPPIEVPEGYMASYFIAPNNITTPSDIVLDSEGTIFVNEIRGDGISKVLSNGKVEHWAEVNVYCLVIDKDSDIIYGYNFVGGSVYKILEDGTISLFAEDWDKLWSWGESDIALNSQGDLFIIRNWIMSSEGEFICSLQKINPNGDIVTIFDEIGHFTALDFNSKDEFFGVGEIRNIYGIYQINPESGEMELIREVTDAYFSWHGLAFDDNDNFYLTNDTSVYKMDASGSNSELLAEGFRGLQGITVDNQGNVFVVSRLDNGVYKITSDGVEQIVTPNYLSTPQAIEFNSQGKLFVNQDEPGVMVAFSGDGDVLEYYEGLWTFQPPKADIAIDDNSDIIFTEACPDVPSRVLRIPEGCTGYEAPCRVEIGDFSKPSGVAIWEDMIYVAECDKGVISRISESGYQEEFVDIVGPGFIEFDQNGDLLVIGGLDIPYIDTGDILYRVNSDRSKEIIYEDEHGEFTFMATDYENTIYLSNIVEILMIDDGEPSVFASGFSSALGLAFDEKGRLYVADDVLNAIIRIERIPPDKPLRPSGSTSGKPDVEYIYTSSTTDPYNNKIYYLWDWCDGNFSGWLGPYDSGDTCEASYSWSERGEYSVRVMTKNIYDAESEWSEPLVVTMPKTRNIQNPVMDFFENYLLIYQILQRFLQI